MEVINLIFFIAAVGASVVGGVVVIWTILKGD